MISFIFFIFILMYWIKCKQPLMSRRTNINPNHWSHGYSKWEVFWKTRGKCFYCEKEFSGIHDPGFTIEHLIPISKGGQDEFSNVFPCCKKCNSSRGNLPLYEWLLLLAEKRDAYKGLYHITNRLDKIIARLSFIYQD